MITAALKDEWKYQDGRDDMSFKSAACGNMPPMVLAAECGIKRREERPAY
jgi:hypothetical protein